MTQKKLTQNLSKTIKLIKLINWLTPVIDLDFAKLNLSFLRSWTLKRLNPPFYKFWKLAKKFDIPQNLLKLIDDDQKAFLALKIVEIIGEDEPYQLDPETIYFVTNLLNKMNLVTLRNKVLNSALPLRT